MLGALASVVVGHYIADVLVMAIAGLRFEGSVGAEDLATLSAVVLVGWLWLRARIGRDIDHDLWARAVWIGIGILALTTIIGMITLARNRAGFVTALAVPPSPSVSLTGRWFLDAALVYVLGFATALPSLAVVKRSRERPTSSRRLVSRRCGERRPSPSSSPSC